jgi:hypothetical protein
LSFFRLWISRDILFKICFIDHIRFHFIFHIYSHKFLRIFLSSWSSANSLLNYSNLSSQFIKNRQRIYVHLDSFKKNSLTVFPSIFTLLPFFDFAHSLHAKILSFSLISFHERYLIIPVFKKRIKRIISQNSVELICIQKFILISSQIMRDQNFRKLIKQVILKIFSLTSYKEF